MCSQSRGKRERESVNCLDSREEERRRRRRKRDMRAEEEEGKGVN